MVARSPPPPAHRWDGQGQSAKHDAETGAPAIQRIASRGVGWFDLEERFIRLHPDHSGIFTVRRAPAEANPRWRATPTNALWISSMATDCVIALIRKH